MNADAGHRVTPEGVKPVSPAQDQAVAGFTLIEVIVALAILSLIMLATVAALRTFANTQASLTRSTERIDEIRSVSSFLRDSFDSTVFEVRGNGLTLGGSGGGELAYFAGTATSIAWKAPILFGEQFGGTFLLQLALVNRQLILKWQEPVEFGQEIEWEGAESRVLVESVDEFQLGFLDRPGGEWLETWDDTETPSLLKMNIKAHDRYWPELVIQVRR